MDEAFEKIINGMVPNQNQYREKFLRRELQIPGLRITVDGKDVKEILESKGFLSFLEQDSAKAQVEFNSSTNNPAMEDNKKKQAFFEKSRESADKKHRFRKNLIRLKCSQDRNHAMAMLPVIDPFFTVQTANSLS